MMPPEPREAADRPRLLLVLTDLQDLRRRNVDSEADAYMRGGIAEWQKVERFFRDVERENQLILRAAGEGIYGVNAEGKTTFVNPAAERMLGWSDADLVGQDMHAIVHHRSEERRVGKECVSTGRSRWWPDN